MPSLKPISSFLVGCADVPDSYGDPGGPRRVAIHSYKLSPFGPAEQFVGGSAEISSSSFWMLHAVRKPSGQRGLT